MARPFAFGSWLLLLAVVASSLLVACFADDDVVMKPVKESSTHVAVVFAQGAQCAPALYVPVLEAVQKASAYALWAAVPATPLNLPNPATLPGALRRVINSLRSAGMPDDTKIFFSGHSLGTVFVQDFAADAKNNASGLILTGGFLARKHLEPFASFPVPTLTIGGELDGLARVTRTVVESIYHLIEKNPATASDFPVVVVDGMNHWQVASGDPTSFVTLRDLEPEIEIEDAHKALGSLFASFITQVVTGKQSSNIQSAVKAARDYSAPLIKAYELEGSRRFNSPDQYGGPGESNCVRGSCEDESPWVKQAQAVIAGDLPHNKLNITNNYVKLSGSPVTGQDFHLPEIFTDNSGVVSISTFAQGTWELLDGSDSGFSYTSASELGAKLASRQCIQINATRNESIPFSVDDPDFCAMINKQVYELALSTAGQRAAQRFKAFGQPYTFAPDQPKTGGPFWLEARLSFTEKDGGSGSKVMEVASPMQKTEKDYWKNHFPFPRPSFIPDPGCYHYCKLLSPARAMEWIFVDGLRLKRSKSEMCDKCLAANTTFCWVDMKCHPPNSSDSPCKSTQCVGEGCKCSDCADETCAISAADPELEQTYLRPPHSNKPFPPLRSTLTPSLPRT